MKVLVYGATGSQQFPIIAALTQKGAQVYATTSSEAGVAKLAQAGATAVLANMADAGRLNEVSLGMDAVAFMIPFSLPDPADGLTYAKHVIDAAKAGGVQLLVWNTSGYLLPQKVGDPGSDVKLDVKDYLAQSGLPYIIMEPSVYAENLLAPFARKYFASERKIAYPTLERMPIGWIATRDVAALQAEALHHPELAGQSFKVSGLENLTGDALAARFTQGLGEAIGYYAMPPQEFGDILGAFASEEAVQGIVGFYQGMAEAPSFPVLFAANMPQVLTHLPVQMTPMEEWVRQHRAVYLNEEMS